MQVICILKTKAICSFFVLFAIVAGIGGTVPAAFADHIEVTIMPDQRSGSYPNDCIKVEHGCYILGIPVKFLCVHTNILFNED